MTNAQPSTPSANESSTQSTTPESSSVSSSISTGRPEDLRAALEPLFANANPESVDPYNRGYLAALFDVYRALGIAE